jgi:hypothetical protein
MARPPEFETVWREPQAVCENDREHRRAHSEIMDGSTITFVRRKSSRWESRSK